MNDGNAGVATNDNSYIRNPIVTIPPALKKRVRHIRKSILSQGPIARINGALRRISKMRPAVKRLP